MYGKPCTFFPLYKSRQVMTSLYTFWHLLFWHTDHANYLLPHTSSKFSRMLFLNVASSYSFNMSVLRSAFNYVKVDKNSQSVHFLRLNYVIVHKQTWNGCLNTCLRPAINKTHKFTPFFLFLNDLLDEWLKCQVNFYIIDVQSYTLKLSVKCF